MDSKQQSFLSTSVPLWDSKEAVIVNCFNLIRVDLNSAMSDHITKKFAKAGAERTLK